MVLSETPERRALLADLNLRSALVALVMAALGAAAVNPFFQPSFWSLFGRTTVLAAGLLVVYALAGHWPERWRPEWLPRGTVQLLAVALAAPLVTAAIYLVGVGGDWRAIHEAPARRWGFLILSGSAMLVGLVVTPLALLRERDAQAKAQALRFALERSQLERQALDARLSLMQAQIEPHFLFNTLANVQALVEEGSPRAAAVLQSLIAYLRAAMPRLHQAQATLGDEAQLVQAYLALMRMRMPDRLQVALDIDPALTTRPFPSMALLTLVENAVRHGIDPAEDGGRIEVGGRPAADGGMHLWVQDSGVGMAPQAQPGLGLTNLRSRLRGVYGEAADVQLSEVAPHGLRVDLHLPARADR